MLLLKDPRVWGMRLVLQVLWVHLPTGRLFRIAVIVVMLILLVLLTRGTYTNALMLLAEEEQ